MAFRPLHGLLGYTAFLNSRQWSPMVEIASQSLSKALSKTLSKSLSIQWNLHSVTLLRPLRSWNDRVNLSIYIYVRVRILHTYYLDVYGRMHTICVK